MKGMLIGKLAAGAFALATATSPALADVTYTFSGFSSIVNAPQSFTLTLPDFLTADTFVPASEFDSCVGGGEDCTGLQFNLVDPHNNFSWSLIDFKTTNTGTFYYFDTSAFTTPGTHTNEYVDFNPASLTVRVDPVNVAEPATLAMLLGGLGLAGVAVRRRRG